MSGFSEPRNYWDRALSRRRLIAAGSAGLAAAGLAACSSSSNNNAGSNAAPKPAASAAGSSAATAAAGTAAAGAGAPAATRAAAATAAPRKGGTVTVGSTVDLQLNTGFPFSFLGGGDTIVQYGSMETLIAYEDSLTPTLRLADRFEYNQDHTQLTIGFRQGAKFFNGTQVGPDDVLLGIDAIVNPAKYQFTGNSQLGTFARAVTNSTKVDDHTLQLTFDQPRANMSDFFAQLMITQGSNFAKLRDGSDVEGTGPYQVKQWNPGQGFHLAPNAAWWDKSRTGGPFLDGIDVKQYADVDALTLGFAAGEIDLAYAVPAGNAAQFQSKNEVHVGQRRGVAYLGSNVTSPLLTDARVRQAIFYALDRQKWVTDHGNGFLKVTVQPWPASSPAFDPALDAPFYDPQKAKQLLQAAGFQQSRPISIEYTPTFQDPAAPDFMQAQLSAIGLKVQLNPLEYSVYLDRFMQKNFMDLYLHSHSFADLAPVTTMSQAVPYQLPNDQGVGGGATRYNSPAYRDVFAKLQTLDPTSDAAKAQYKIFNNLLITDCWIAPYTESPSLDLVGSKIRGQDKYWISIGQQPDYGALWKAS